MTGTTEQGAPIPLSEPVSTYYRFWIVLAVILGSDQITKWVIVDHSGLTLGLYPPFDGYEIIPGFFNIVYSVNYGAAWGILQGYAWLLVLLAVLVLALIGIFHKQLGLACKAQQLCFGLIGGGIIGNTLDRLLRGHVVDFLDFHLPVYRWPTFNIADSAIVIGTFWYIYLQLRLPSAK